MLTNKVVLLLLLCTLHLCDYVWSKCEIHSIEPRPIFWKELRSRKVVIPKSLASITIENDDEIHMHCSTASIWHQGQRSNYDYYQTFQSQFTHGKTVTLKCRNDNIFYEETWQTENDAGMNKLELSCEGRAISLYESNKSLPNCSNFMSYGFGVHISSKEEIITAKTCFDLMSLKPKYVAFSLYNAQSVGNFKMIPLKDQEHLFALDLPVNGLNTFWINISKFEFNAAFKEKTKSNIFLSIFDFEYSGIIQDENINDELGEYGQMFMTIWWHDFRVGIWKIYLNALRQQAENEKFEVYAGTLGRLMVPTDDCRQNEVLSMDVNGMRIIAPEYVWNLVVPREDSEQMEPVVIIGYNSPFLKALNETKFCKDICHAVPWLNTNIFEKLRQFPAVGLIHCCRPESVMNVIDNMPWPIEDPNRRENKTIIERTTSLIQRMSGNNDMIDPFKSSTATEDYNED